MIIQVGDEIRADQLPSMCRGLYRFEWGNREYLFPGARPEPDPRRFTSGIPCFSPPDYNTQYLGGNAKILILGVPD